MPTHASKTNLTCPCRSPPCSSVTRRHRSTWRTPDSRADPGRTRPGAAEDVPLRKKRKGRGQGARLLRIGTQTKQIPGKHHRCKTSSTCCCRSHVQKLIVVRKNLVRGHQTGSGNSGVKAHCRTRKKRKKKKLNVAPSITTVAPTPTPQPPDKNEKRTSDPKRKTKCP